MINVELKVISGKHSGQVIPLTSAKFLIGREQDCQLRPNSELVSRHHCVFTVDDFSVRVRDLGSTNGTLVNGERIRKEVVLQQSDKVLVGNLEFAVCINESASGTDGKLSPTSEDTVVARSDTVSEMMAMQPQGSSAAEPPATPAPSQPAAPAIASNPTPQPVTATLGTGDTTVIELPAMIPGQMPYQPMMPPMGYPMYGGYPYPGMPGQMPGQMPMYPQPYPMQQPMYGVPQQQEAEPQTAAAPAAGLGVSLPDPSETGAKEAPPKPPEPEAQQAAAPKGEKSNGAADAIIKQYMQRRPGR